MEVLPRFPKIEFRLSSGEVVRFEFGAGSEEPAHAVGDRVRVRCRTNGPPDAEVDDFFSRWRLSLVFGVLGAAFLAIGGGLLLGRIAP